MELFGKGRFFVKKTGIKIFRKEILERTDNSFRLFCLKGGCMMSRTLDYIALVVVFIGAVNWGLVGLFRLDLVRLIFGDMSWISRIVYVLVGICGIYLLTFLGRIGREE